MGVEEFFKAMETDAVGSRMKEVDPGCHRFDLLRNKEEPTKFVFYEAFESDEAVAVHKETSHYKAWADFKTAFGIVSQSATKWATVSADWGFQKEQKAGPAMLSNLWNISWTWWSQLYLSIVKESIQ